MNTKEILHTFETSSSFLITTHVNPDPDAIGSQLALFFYLKSRGKRVVAVNDGPWPKRFAFIPGIRSVRDVADVKRVDFETAILVDCGERGRMGKVRALIPKGKTVINIDHHITNDFFGTYNLVVPTASSTAEVIFDLLMRAQARLDKRIATLLYLGIMTDTGSFRYENTSPHTHEVTSCLLRFGFSVTNLYKKLYESLPASDVVNFTNVLGSFEILCGKKVVLMELPRATLKRFSSEIDLRDQLFKFLRFIRGVEVIVILTEEGKGRTRLNFRSQGTFDVARLAAVFGGGGHSRASGAVTAGEMPSVRRAVLREIKKSLVG